MARYHSHDLHSLIGLDLAQVVAWFLAHGGLYGESLDADDLEVVDGDLYVGGYQCSSSNTDTQFVGICQTVGTESRDSVLFVCACVFTCGL